MPDDTVSHASHLAGIMKRNVGRTISGFDAMLA